MKGALLLFYVALLWAIDEAIKWLFVGGYSASLGCIDLRVVYNHGVAFSFLSGLGEKLKWLQLTLITLGAFYIVRSKLFAPSPWLWSLVLAGATANLFDRFNYGGVVDYLYWHCGFNYPVFNLADIYIDLAVGLLLYREFRRN